MQLTFWNQMKFILPKTEIQFSIKQIHFHKSREMFKSYQIKKGKV